MNKQQIEAFFAETRETFRFLEAEYGYQWLHESIKHPNDLRDMAAISRYVSERVGVEVWWYLGDAAIGVAFVELKQPNVFPASVSFYPQFRTEIPRAINLSTLAEMQGALNDPHFLLGEVDNTHQFEKREQLIASNWRDIVVGLAQATQTYAQAILKGDTSLFPQVMDFYLAKHRQLYPNMFIPGLKPNEEQSER